MNSLSPSLYIYCLLSPHSHRQTSMPIPNFPKSPIPVLHKMTCHSSRTQTAQSNPLSLDPNRPQIEDNLNCYVKLCRPSFSDLKISSPIEKNESKTPTAVDLVDPKNGDNLWLRMKQEASLDVQKEPILSNYYFSSILCHNSIESALSNHLSMKLGSESLPVATFNDILMGLIDREIILAVECDLRAVKERDPACISYVHCFLYFKGFLACQAHRIAHKLWSQGRKTLALLIQSRVSEVFAVDIHPGAKIGRGILLDHATGVVVGETAVIGNDVSILHNVTLGGTGKESGVRHPSIGNGVLIGAGTCVLGNVKIGDGVKIGAGSVVLKEVPPRTTAVGNPARLIGGKENPIRLDKIPSLTMDHTSDISEWSDYVI